MRPMPRRPTHRYALLLMLSSVWLALVVAPAVLAESSPLAASGLYLAFSRVCHQLADRSLHLAGHPIAVCHRCLGIYLGFWLGVLAWPWLHSAARLLLRRPRLILIPAAFLLLNALLPNTPESRFLTGIAVGFPVALFVWIAFEQLLHRQPQGAVHAPR